MFEKEAEIYALSNFGFKGKNSKRVFTAKIDYQYGAEFGYNKCKEEINKKGLALQSDMDETIEQNIALKKELEKTEWHKVSEQVPTEEKQYLLKFKDGTIDVLYVGIDGNLEPFILTRECFEFYKDVEKWCEIPEED